MSEPVKVYEDRSEPDFREAKLPDMPDKEKIVHLTQATKAMLAQMAEAVKRIEAEELRIKNSAKEYADAVIAESINSFSTEIIHRIERIERQLFFPPIINWERFDDKGESE